VDLTFTILHFSIENEPWIGIDVCTPPVYTNTFGLPSDDTETSDAGAIFWADLPTGTYTMPLSHATRTCTHWLSWPGSGDNEVRVPVREGFHTQASIACPE